MLFSKLNFTVYFVLHVIGNCIVLVVSQLPSQYSH